MSATQLTENVQLPLLFSSYAMRTALIDNCNDNSTALLPCLDCFLSLTDGVDCSGFGFVSFTSQEDCERALNAMNGADVDGRSIKVEKARRNGGYQKTPGVCK